MIILHINFLILDDILSIMKIIIERTLIFWIGMKLYGFLFTTNRIHFLIVYNQILGFLDRDKGKVGFGFSFHFVKKGFIFCSEMYIYSVYKH